MEKRWSGLDTFLSVLASVATILSFVFGFLYNSAVNATVKIEQDEGKPLEIKIVDFPDLFGKLQEENERLKEELRGQTAPIGDTPQVQVKIINTPQTSGTYLFTLVPVRQNNWNIVLDSSGAPSAIAGNAEGGSVYAGTAGYDINKKYQTLEGIIIPSEDIKVDWDFSFTIWADGVPIYGSPKINRDGHQFSFAVNIENTNHLSMEAYGGPLILCNFILK